MKPQFYEGLTIHNMINVLFYSDWMKLLIDTMDFRTLEMKTFMCKVRIYQNMLHLIDVIC